MASNEEISSSSWKKFTWFSRFELSKWEPSWWMLREGYKSVAWVLMTWLLTSGHQHPWCQLCSIDRFLISQEEIRAPSWRRNFLENVNIFLYFLETCRVKVTSYELLSATSHENYLLRRLNFNGHSAVRLKAYPCQQHKKHHNPALSTLCVEKSSVIGGFPAQRARTQKTYPCHDVIMTMQMASGKVTERVVMDLILTWM